jgi:hypothetical protein
VTIVADGTNQQVIGPNNTTKFFTGFAPQSARVQNGYEWQIAIGGPLPSMFAMPGWDFRASYTGIRARGKHSGAASYYYSSFGSPSATTEKFHTSIHQQFDIGDFDIGHDVGLGALPLHAYGGVRLVSFGQTDNMVVTESGFPPGGNISEQIQSRYFGAGPRLGFDFKYPLWRVGSVSVSMAEDASGSVIFGSSSLKASYSNTSGFGPLGGAEAGTSANLKPVYNLEGMLGLAFDFPLSGNTGEVTVGYRGQAWMHVLDTEVRSLALAGSGGMIDGNQFFSGPFVQFALKW